MKTLYRLSVGAGIPTQVTSEGVSRFMFRVSRKAPVREAVQVLFPVLYHPMGVPPPPVYRILKDLEAWQSVIPANKGLSPRYRQTKELVGAGRQLSVASCQKSMTRVNRSTISRVAILRGPTRHFAARYFRRVPKRDRPFECSELGVLRGLEICEVLRFWGIDKNVSRFAFHVAAKVLGRASVHLPTAR